METGHYPALGETLVLPFFSPVIPTPLPSEEEIHSPDEVLSENLGRKVVRIGSHLVVKYGHTVEEIEAETMIFVKENTSIPVPRVFAVFRSKHNDMLYIIMEYIQGSTLLEKWPNLCESQKAKILSQLKNHLDLLRQLPQPGYFGSIGRRHMPNGIFWSEGDDYDIRINGPFETEAALNEALALKSIQIAEFNQRKGRKGAFYRRMLPKVLKGHTAVFTHGDFQRKNIIIQERNPTHTDDGQPVIQEDGFDVVIIDWEQAGWYPNYWEYCAASWAFRFDDDWPDSIERVLDPWPIEYAWLSMIGNELWS